MTTFRMGMPRHKLAWDFHCKLWWGALCVIVFGGELCVGVRGLHQDMSSSYENNGLETPINITFSKEDVALRCEVEDLEITTSIAQYLPNGMPFFHVEIANTCVYCSFKDIHVACGEWASQTLVDPKIFRRVAVNDCLVKDGNALAAKDIVYFEYSNSFAYDLSPTHANRACGSSQV